MGNIFGFSTNFKFGPTKSLIQELDDERNVDLVILTKEAIGQLADKNVVQFPFVDLASTGIGLAKRPGLKSPDISTVKGFKNFLTTSTSIAYTSDGVSGIYIANLIEEFHMTEALRAKTKKVQGGYAAELIIQGDCDYALQNISELMGVKGIEIVGPFPDQIQLVTIFSGAVTRSSNHTKMGIDFLKTLESAKAQSIFKSRGLEVINK